jgi:hypothetical protein
VLEPAITVWELVFELSVNPAGTLTTSVNGWLWLIDPLTSVTVSE